MSKVLVILLAVIVQCISAHRSLPSGITCGSQFASPNSPLVIPNPKISWANYALFTCEHPIAWYEAQGTKDQEFKFTLTVPVIDRFKDVRMTTVIIGDGLPAVPQGSNIPEDVSKYISDNNLGAVVYKSPVDQSTCNHLTSQEMAKESTVKDGRCHFYEPFGGSNLWVVADSAYKLPTTGTFKIAVYEENRSTAKASFACCDWPEDFQTQFQIPKSTCEACGSQESNSAWSSLFYEHKSMTAYGGYPPLQNCATDSTPISLPQGDKCPPPPSDGNGGNKPKQPESCNLGCGMDGECHSHNVFGECTHELEWSLMPKFGEANVTKVVIFKGDKIRFKAPNDQLAHNLYEMKDDAALAQCAFDGSKSLAGVEEVNIGHDVVFDKAGTYYFTCAIGCNGQDFCHCRIGQKLTVEVKDATEGLRCHTHNMTKPKDTNIFKDEDKNLKLPIPCPPAMVNARSVNNKVYGARSENECSEQCIPETALNFMSGIEKGSCQDIGFNSDLISKTINVDNAPGPVRVIIAKKGSRRMQAGKKGEDVCHCHSYEKISCENNDPLYAEHITEIETYCKGILDRSEDVCPYKCFQPIEVLHLHYLECPSRPEDPTYTNVAKTNKCHIAAIAPNENSCALEDPTQPTSSSLSFQKSSIIICSMILSSMMVFL